MNLEPLNLALASRRRDVACNRADCAGYVPRGFEPKYQMNQDKSSRGMEGDNSKTVPCMYCRDPIPPDALICRTCNEPQDWGRRTTKFLSVALSSLVAVLSLGLAYVQYRDEKAAQAEASTAKANAATESKAYEDAFQRIRQKFDANPAAWQQAKQQWLSQLRSQSATAPAQARSSTNWSTQSDFLVRHFLDPNEKP
jgi:hypothetical protein